MVHGVQCWHIYGKAVVQCAAVAVAAAAAAGIAAQITDQMRHLRRHISPATCLQLHLHRVRC